MTGNVIRRRSALGGQGLAMWLAAVAVAVTLPTRALPASADWRQEATPEDVQRYRSLDRVWVEALAQARRAGYGRQIERLGPVADPGLALPRPQPTPGAYRCRTIKLGSPGGRGLPFVPYGWFKCRVDLTPGGDLILAKTTGSQRPYGHLYPQADRRLVYLGAVALGDEARVGYGDNPERDQIGAFERIGRDRYRLALPHPKQESLLDLIELAK